MCVLVLSFPVGGFSKHNVKERKYMKLVKKRQIDNKNLGNNL